MDQYCEYLVKQRTAPWRKGLNFLTAALCVLCLIGGFRITPWLLLLAVALGAGAWFLFRTTEVEYEYLLIEEEFSVDCIYHLSGPAFCHGGALRLAPAWRRPQGRLQGPGLFFP